MSTTDDLFTSVLHSNATARFDPVVRVKPVSLRSCGASKAPFASYHEVFDGATRHHAWKLTEGGRLH